MTMDRAVVLGGSIAGLLAARVLIDHAPEVVVVDRDDLSGGFETRRGVPQGRQVHGLLARGLEEMETLFPGITDEMVEGGAQVGDPGVDCHWHVNGVRKALAAIGPGIACTRPFLEWHLRRRLQALTGVSVMHAHVDGLTATDGRVDGVAVSKPDGRADHVAGDLVVDCTGTSSRIDTWLGALGYDPPPERRIAVDLGYASRFYRRAAGERLDGAMAVISVAEDYSRPRGAVAFAVEGDQWMVTVGAYHHDRPSSDQDDFAARLREDQTPAIRRFADDAEVSSTIATYRYPSSVRRDFHKIRRLPGGLVAAGDSVASFNPLYGQGMTSAALHANTLAAYLAAGASPHEPARGYFKRLRPVVDSVWRISATADFRLSHVTGDRPPGLWLIHRVNDLYTQATLRDSEMHGLFLRVLNLQEKPEAMMRPGTLVKAYRASRRPAPSAPAREGTGSASTA